MYRQPVVIALTLFASMTLAAPARAGKVPDLGKTKFKDIVKYLDLTAEQQAKIKLNVERIQDIVKDANKQRVTGIVGRRAPVGGSGALGRPGGDPGSGTEVMTPGKFEERRAQRKEWQTEIDNRVDEIKSFLNPAQLEKFKSIGIPNLMALPDQGSWRD